MSHPTPPRSDDHRRDSAGDVVARSHGAADRVRAALEPTSMPPVSGAPSRWVLAGIGMIALAVSLAVGHWVATLYRISDNQRHVQLVLTQLQALVNAQQTLADLAVQGGDGTRTISDKSDDNARERIAALGSVELPEHPGDALITVRDAERAYRLAVTKEFELIASADLGGAIATLNGEIRHDYNDLSQQLRDGITAYEDAALRSRKLADAATVTALFLAVGVMIFLASQLTRARRHAVAMTEERTRSRNSEERFRSLVQNSSDVITVIERDTTIRFVSPAAERVLGYLSSNLLDSRLSSLLHADDRARALTLLTDASQRPGVQKPAVWRVRHADGRWLYMENVATNLLADPTVGGIVLNTRDVSERMLLEQQLTHQAFHDSLTGLANRALFRDRVEHALARDNRKAASGVAVLFLDLDNFKAVNDSLGHGEGDRLLVGVSERMVECIRAADTGARLGGDEFAVLIEDAPDIGTIVAIAERIVAALQLPFVLQGKPVAVGASIGIAQASADGGAGELLRNADVAMYTAKSRGKGRYEIFQPEMHTAVLARLQLEADLRHAVERGEFRLHYQPIVELDTGHLSGLEALCRWQHPEKGLVSPATFIPLAEEMGLIVPLGRWALHAACIQAREWQTRHPAAQGVSVSVNISGRQLDNASLVEDVASALRGSGLGAESLVLEITESVIMHNTDDTLHRLKDLKSLGVRLAIDDFGTGFSSLSYLQRFPVDILKIDKSFIDGFGAGGKDSALVRTIIALSDTMKLRTVAEGVETAEQAEELRSLGCGLAQGYHFARPMAPADVDDYLTREEALVG